MLILQVPNNVDFDGMDCLSQVETVLNSQLSSWVFLPTKADGPSLPWYLTYGTRKRWIYFSYEYLHKRTCIERARFQFEHSSLISRCLGANTYITHINLCEHFHEFYWLIEIPIQHILCSNNFNEVMFGGFNWNKSKINCISSLAHKCCIVIW